MKLTQVTIHKYKSFESDQTFKIEDGITILVGMNESGKTSALEALAKSNYFQNDKNFKYSTTHDYPRKEKKKLDKSGEKATAITCTYELSDKEINLINSDLGSGVLTQSHFKVSHNYSNSRSWYHINCNERVFTENKLKALNIFSKTLHEKLNSVKDAAGLKALCTEYKDETIVIGLNKLTKYYENKNSWATNVIDEYVVRTYFNTTMPKFLYYDEYYALPSRISIENLQNEELNLEEQKTAKALFELADINISELLKSDSYEDFRAELEATQATITEELFKYWETNKNLEIIFDIDKVEHEVSRTMPNSNGYGGEVTVKDVKILEHILDIRVKNRRSGVSLPLKNRSKGFNWFFSFLVWFKKIQEDQSNNYILLLDEPGLNLHASAQKNLLNFLDDLAVNYQIVYTTHSPFMIDSKDLHKVRTVLETEKGSVISDSIQEKDPNTLFPLQAALGYDIAQNLFISKHNLLVEGASDLLYIQVMSTILQSIGRTGLDEKVTIVPTGGLDKVATFISLLRGSDLNIACLLDTFKEGRSKFEDLIDHKIITKNKIRFFDEFLADYSSADIEDLFTKSDYLKFYNEAFPEKQISLVELNDKIKPTLVQISKHLNVSRFNHYRPANKLASKGVSADYFESVTLDNFEKVFVEMNKLF